jgi:hypothetical protein
MLIIIGAAPSGGYPGSAPPTGSYQGSAPQPGGGYPGYFTLCVNFHAYHCICQKELFVNPNCFLDEKDVK